MKPAEPPTPAAGNPFLGPEVAAAPQPRARKAKPPPAIVSAGGVDMARAHANNIQLTSPNKRGPTISPKVVIGVETNPRRAPTMPRMNVGRGDATPPSDAPPPASADGSPWARAGAATELDKSALPSASMPHDDQPEPARKKTRGAGWIGIAAIVVLILLAAGIIRRVRMHYQAREEAAATPPVVTAAPSALEPSATAEPEPSASATAEAEPAELEPTESATALAPPPTSTARTSPAPKTTAAVKGTSKPTAAPLPPKPVFKPPFELPEEKK